MTDLKLKISFHFLGSGYTFREKKYFNSMSDL